MQQNRELRIGSLTSSPKELTDLLKAWIVISLAFAVFITLYQFQGALWSQKFVFSLIISAFTVGTGFLIHELAHKIVAQHYGCFAEFRSFDTMLLLAFIMSFFGFIFAAPGAVMIDGPVGIRRNGKISMAGPLTNLIFAAVFLIGMLLFTSNVLHTVASYGFYINTVLGLFNMIPVWNFDGRKILAWNKAVYGAMVGVGILFLIMQIVAKDKGLF